jgi:hypothetical protein
MVVAAGVFAGVASGLFLAALAWCVHHWFGSQVGWLLAIGVALSLVASPKVMTPHVAVPAEIAVLLIIVRFLF